MGAAMYAAGESEAAASGAGDFATGDADDDVVDAEIVEDEGTTGGSEGESK
jgi:molecular chaperone DnaK